MVESVDPSEFRYLKFFDSLATVLVIRGDGDGNGRGYIRDGSGIRIDRELITGVTGSGNRGDLFLATEDFVQFPKEDVGLSEVAKVFTKSKVSKKFVSFSETGEAEDKLLFPQESGDEFRITSV